MPIAAADDRHRLVPGGGWAPFDRTDLETDIASRFARRVRLHAHRPAIHSLQERASYAELAARAWRVAHAILARRGDSEEPVALLLDQGVDLVAAILGTLAAGKIYVPLDPAHAEERNRLALKAVGPVLLLTTAAHKATATGWIGTERVLSIDSIDPALPSDDPKVAIGPGRLAYVYFTSGSTGAPKGVCDRHRNVLHNILRYTDSLKIGCEDRLTLLQGPAFSGAVSSLFAAVLNGACSHVVDLRREGFPGLARRIAAERITMLHAVPSIFREICATNADLTSLRVVRLEGDASTNDDAARFSQRLGQGCMLVNGLGATETGLSCQYFMAPDGSRQAGALPVGFPTADVSLEIVDGLGRPIASGATGELVVASPFLAAGYWNDARLTESRFWTGPDGVRRYRTGDLARQLANGAVVLQGRQDELLKVGGEWLNIASFEASLCRIAGITAAAVLVHQRLNRLELVAYVVPAPGVEIDAAAVRQHLRQTTPLLRVPAVIEPIAAMPLDANGKIDRRALPSLRCRRPPVPPPAAVGTVLPAVLDCWRHVLASDAAIDGRSFADEGGDSFAALQLAMLLEERLGRHVPPDLVRAETTVAGLAHALASPKGSDALHLLADGGDGRAIFLIHGVGGHLLQLVPLAERLAIDRPVYGLRFPDMDGGVVPPSDLARLAASYAALIREREPQGPYTVGGNCLGGVLALEVARCLIEDGERVDPVVMIETTFADGLHRPSPGRAGLMRPLIRRMRALPAKLRRHAIGGAWDLCRLAGTGLPPALRDAPTILILAARRYKPRPIAASCLYCSLGESADAAEWSRMFAGGLEHVVLPRRAPPAAAIDALHVDPLARALRQRLHMP